MEEGASRGTEAGLLTYPLENLKLFVGKFSEPEGHEGGPQLAAVEGSLAARVEYLESLRHRVEVRYLVLQQQLLQVVHTQLLHMFDMKSVGFECKVTRNTWYIHT